MKEAFSIHIIGYKRSLGINTQNISQKLTVAGNALAVAYFASSDKRFKKDIKAFYLSIS